MNDVEMMENNILYSKKNFVTLSSIYRHLIEKYRKIHIFSHHYLF